MLNQFSRLELAIGAEGLELLQEATVAIVGIGGVGAQAVDALARSGVGKIILIDKDNVDITNINRQLHATLDTVGQSKVTLMEQRIASINPDCEVITYHMFLEEETKALLFQHDLDFVIDACDTVSAKLLIIKECLARGIRFISSMGAANKMDPTRFQIADITKTTYDPLAKVIRTKLRKERIRGKVPVVFSTESPIVPRKDVNEVVGNQDAKIRKAKMPPASNAFVPTVAGLICASYVVNTLVADVAIQTVEK
ncbi:MAG: tRNA threonylcarbamoyladenosine dehydratase [Culicoidibacterales bacterium]